MPTFEVDPFYAIQDEIARGDWDDLWQGPLGGTRTGRWREPLDIMSLAWPVSFSKRHSDYDEGGAFTHQPRVRIVPVTHTSTPKPLTKRQRRRKGL